MKESVVFDKGNLDKICINIEVTFKTDVIFH